MYTKKISILTEEKQYSVRLDLEVIGYNKELNSFLIPEVEIGNQVVKYLKEQLHTSSIFFDEDKYEIVFGNGFKFIYKEDSSDVKITSTILERKVVCM